MNRTSGFLRRSPLLPDVMLTDAEPDAVPTTPRPRLRDLFRRKRKPHMRIPSVEGQLGYPPKPPEPGPPEPPRPPDHRPVS